jgi:hypothetical protein
MAGFAEQPIGLKSVLTHCNKNQALASNLLATISPHIVKKWFKNPTEYWDLLFKQLDYITKKSKLTYNLLPLVWSLWIFLTDRDKI